MTTLAQKALDLTRKYGIAWVLVNQTLAWISYFALVVLLIYFEFDVKPYFKVIGISYDFGSLSSYGLAILLNRFLTPLRILMTTSLMPVVGNRINTLFNPLVSRFWPEIAEDESFPGIEEAEDKNK